MTTLETDLVALSDLSQDFVESVLNRLTAGQLRYLEALPAAPSKAEACRRANVNEDTVSSYRARDPEFRRLDDAISLKQDVHCRTAIAKAVLGQHAPKAALRIVQLSEAPAKTDRQLQVALQASVKTLEAVGVLKAGGGIQVNVDNRKIDVYAKERWLSEGQDAWRNRKRLPAKVSSSQEPPS